jgi:hypothetical protein
MKVEINLDKRKLDRLGLSAAGVLETIIGTAAHDIANDIVLSFGTSPNGRRYGRHIASRPGYPPNIDTGALRASIKAVRKGRYVWWVQDGVPYGIELELGRERTAPRPFMRPMIELWRRQRMRELAERVKRGLGVS